MAVYKRNYRAYAGRVTPVRWRWLTLARFSLADVFASRITVLLFVLCLVPPLITAIVIYAINSDIVRTLLNMQKVPFTVGNQFFLTLFGMQGWLALFLTAWIGPASVSPDLTNGGLPLFLSRPISRAEYIGGKLLMFAVVLSAVTWVPLLLLFGIQTATAPGPWLMENLFIAWGIFWGSAIWIAVLGLLALAVSAWVRWRIVASGVMVAAILVPAGFGGVISAIMRTKWGFVLNIPYVTAVIWSHLLRVSIGGATKVKGETVGDLPVSAAWLSLLAVCIIAVLLLNARIRARQVVRG